MKKGFFLTSLFFVILSSTYAQTNNLGMLIHQLSDSMNVAMNAKITITAPNISQSASAKIELGKCSSMLISISGPLGIKVADILYKETIIEQSKTDPDDIEFTPPIMTINNHLQSLSYDIKELDGFSLSRIVGIPMDVYAVTKLINLLRISPAYLMDCIAESPDDECYYIYDTTEKNYVLCVDIGELIRFWHDGKNITRIVDAMLETYMDVTYSDLTLVDGYIFAKNVNIKFPIQNIQIDFKISDIDVNSKLPLTEKFRIPKGYKVIEIKADEEDEEDNYNE